MIKFIRSLILFGFIFILVYILSVCLIGIYFPMILKPNINFHVGGLGRMDTRISEIKEYSDVDILFLGSSHAYRGFDTRMYKEIGLDVFNLGSSNQTPMQTKVIIHRYLQDLKPKSVILEVNPMSFESDGIESALDLIANDKNDIETLKMIWKLKHIKVLNTAIIGFLRDWTDWNIGNGVDSKNANDNYIRGGFVEKELEFYKPKKILSKKIILKKDQLLAFENIIEDLTDEGIEIFLIRAPVTNNLYQSYTNNEDFDIKMNNYAPYLNFYNLMSLTDTLHFYDQHHLNQKGVQMFNNLVIDKLKLKEGN